MHIESEMKFSLDSLQLRKLLQSKRVKQAAEGRAVRRELVSTYFDTRQHSLRKAGAVMRVRQSGERFEQTVKLPAPGPIGMQNFEEWTIPLPAGQPDLHRLEQSVVRRLRPGGRRLNLRPMFTSEIQRTTLVLKRGATRFEMALDEGRILGHASRQREFAVCEVEFELLEGPPLQMLDFILTLSDEIDLQPLYLTKAQRGYALARPALRLRQTKASAVALTPDINVGEAFRRIVGEAVGHLQSNQQPILEGQPGGIHQARVSIRRIRAALRAFKRVLPYDKRKAFNGEFRWFQARLAPARDWHVFLSETLPQINNDRAAAPVDPARLQKLAVKERRRATREARELLCSRRYTRLLLQFQRWLLALESDNAAMFDMPLMPFATSVLDRTRRDFLLDTRPLSRMSEEDRHSLRKRGKKARYATEFFSGPWQGAPVERYLELMEAIQDRLGEANDAVVARMLMASLSPRALDARSLLLVQDWSQSRELECIRAGQPVWRRMQRARPFWA